MPDPCSQRSPPGPFFSNIALDNTMLDRRIDMNTKRECPRCKTLVEVVGEAGKYSIECPTCNHKFDIVIAAEFEQPHRPRPAPQTHITPQSPTPRPPVPDPGPRGNKLTQPAATPSSSGATSTVRGITYGQGVAIILILLANAGFPLLSALKPVPKWEYRLESPSDTSFQRTMDRLGADGWELIFARRATSDYSGLSYEMIFKRPRQGF